MPSWMAPHLRNNLVSCARHTPNGMKTVGSDWNQKTASGGFDKAHYLKSGAHILRSLDKRKRRARR